MTTNQTLPVTLLSGFLGAGKTTLVNHILSQPHGRSLLVLVNEFGPIGIDADLIVNRSGDVIEMANGCVCCVTQGDLRRTLREVAQRKGIDGVLIELSGLADPGPVIAEFDGGALDSAFRLEAVITVIDAENFDRNLDHVEAAYQQIIGADLLIINKTDVVEPEIVDRIGTGLRKLNGHAGQITARQCDVPLDMLFGPANRVARHGSTHGGHDQDHGHGHHHHDHTGYRSEAIELQGPLDPVRFEQWLEALPASVYRLKGFVRFVGADAPVIVHVVGKRRSVEAVPADLGPVAQRLVLIGKDMDLGDCMVSLMETVRQESSH